MQSQLMSQVQEPSLTSQCFYIFFFFLMIRRPPRSTLFPYRRSSDLGYSSSGGSIRCTGTGGSVTFGSTTIATSCYGVEKRINIIHNQDHYVQWYVNGTKKCEQTDTESGITNYHKFGCYGTLNTGSVTVYWRA